MLTDLMHLWDSVQDFAPPGDASVLGCLPQLEQETKKQQLFEHQRLMPYFHDNKNLFQREQINKTKKNLKTNKPLQDFVTPFCKRCLLVLYMYHM